MKLYCLCGGLEILFIFIPLMWLIKKIKNVCKCDCHKEKKHGD